MGSEDWNWTLMKLCREHNAKFVRFEFADWHGISRGKTIDSDYITKYKNGVNLAYFMNTPDMHVLPGYTGDAGYPDSYLIPDVSTFSMVPWSDTTARVICDMKGASEKESCRLLAKTQVQNLEEMGYRLLSGFEEEYWVYNGSTGEPDRGKFNFCTTLYTTQDQDFLDKFHAYMKSMKVNIGGFHSEYCPGQRELNMRPCFGLDIADKAFTLRTYLKEYFERQPNDLQATFMTKPWGQFLSSGQHFSQSLWDLNESGVMYNKNTGDLSDIGRYWQGGLLKHAMGLSALCAPTINCMKRYKDASYAPTLITWGVQNRSCCSRVKISGETGTLIENRIVSSAANPYLVLAGHIAAGIDGIKNKIEPPPRVDGVAWGMEGDPKCPYELLPKRLDQSLKFLKEDRVLCESLGQGFIDYFCTIKQDEIDRGIKACGSAEALFAPETSQYERDIYMEIL